MSFTFFRYLNLKSIVGISYVEKVGMSFFDYYDDKYSFMGDTFLRHGGNGVYLVYYKSNSITWIDSANYYTGIIQPLSANSFSLFPNPATDEVNITASADESGTTFDISLFDITGKCIRTIQKTSVNKLSLKVNDLPQGFYWLRLTSDKGFSASKRFVIAR